MAATAPRTMTPPVRVCTIAATNYLGRVRVLAESVRRNGLDDGLWVFLIDDPDGETPVDHEPFNLLRLDDLDLDPSWFAQMTIYYSVTELATAVKPSVLAGLINGAAGPASAVAYLDPDTELFAPLDDIWTACAADDVIMLTPHILRPFPIDNLQIAERMLLLSGTFNLGFVAVPASPRGRSFTDWWGRRLRFDALVSPGTGLFTDQRWIDLAPGLFATRIVDDPGVNVAYWNLHERPIERDGALWRAGGVPLRLFHYSGFDPARPHQVSVHQGSKPRVLRSDSPELGQLLDRYAEVVKANDTGGDDPWTYRWSHLPNGIRLTDMLRRLYRTELMADELGIDGLHQRPPTPGEEHWLANLVDWLCSPVNPRMLPRHVESLLADRHDLSAAVSDLDPVKFAQVLSDWLATSGVEQEGLTASYALRLGTVLTQWSAAMDDAAHRGDPPGVEMVNVVGFHGATSGLSTGGRQIMAALDGAGIANRVVSVEHPNTRTWNADATIDVGLFELGPPVWNADITIAALNPDILTYMGPITRRRIFGDSHRIGYWWWEVDTLPPEFRTSLGEVDEVWVGSTFVAELFGQLTDRPVYRVPLPVRVPNPGGFDRARFGIDANAMMFSFVFDHSSVLARKNPLGVIAAYCDAFTPDDGCTLVIKSINSYDHRVDAEAIRHAVAARSDVVLVEQRLTDGELDGLIADSTAYVSLHRSEGLGLTILDACLLGVPVVASAQGGCMDFLAPDSSWLVPTTPVAVGPHNVPYPADAMWAEPDHDAAVAHLRAVANDPAAARRNADMARARATDTYDALVCSDVITARINHLRSPRATPAPAVVNR
jgi:glycosyltransferase involved in cell wall biosynthesis